MPRYNSSNIKMFEIDINKNKRKKKKEQRNNPICIRVLKQWLSSLRNARSSNGTLRGHWHETGSFKGWTSHTGRGWDVYCRAVLLHPAVALSNPYLRGTAQPASVEYGKFTRMLSELFESEPPTCRP